ncbi:MAG: TIGR01777 family protein [Ignavibacteriales bacterium]|nr:TIGR01777 family protein [Ignavibacteriales bacterium]
MSKRIVVTGATGLIGRKLVRALIQRGDNVIVFSRDAEKAKSFFPKAMESVEWNYQHPEQWKYKIERTDAVVHLAGVNLFVKRWNDEFKRVVLESRELSTKNLVEAIKSCTNKPEVFVSASGIGYYGDCGETMLNENSAKGNDFLADVCEVWENESVNVEESGVRSVQIRTGIVLTAEDGALKQMLLPFKLFIGGHLGNGKQWASWLHIDDIVEIYLHAIDNSSLTGSLNASSPNPMRMKEFAQTLARVLHRPSLFPVPKFILRLVVGEASEVVLASQRIDVKKLVESGYKFKFEILEDALRDLLN